MVNDKSSLSFPGATLAIIIQMNIDTAVILSALIAVFYTWIGRELRPRGGGGIASLMGEYNTPFTLIRIEIKSP